MKRLLVVMAHRAAQDVFDRHLEEWTKHGDDILVFCPRNAMVDVPMGSRITVMGNGQASHHDAEAIRRFHFLFQRMHEMNYDQFVVFEYDSFCLGDNLPTPQHMAAMVFHDNRPNRGFVGEVFVHPPLFMSQLMVSVLNAMMPSFTMIPERGFWDRWLGLILEKTRGLAIEDLLTRGLGFSRNTIEDAEIPAAVAAVRAGVTCFHGVKSKQAYEAIRGAYNDIQPPTLCYDKAFDPKP